MLDSADVHVARFRTDLGALVTDKNEPNGSVAALCASTFSIDVANDIQPRECINEADSFKGVVLVGRQPTGSFDPELELEVTHPVWDRLATARRMDWRVLIGTTRANVVQFRAPSTQYANVAYAERNGLRVTTVDLRLSGNSDAGDDEIVIAFY